MSSTGFVDCYCVAPLAAATPTRLTDSFTAQQAVLPGGSVVQEVWLHATGPLVALTPTTLSIGTAGSTGSVVSTADLVTNTALNAADLCVQRSGTLAATAAAQALVLTSTETVTSGGAHAVIFYAQFGGLP
jgi:hypothetical protein